MDDLSWRGYANGRNGIGALVGRGGAHLGIDEHMQVKCLCWDGLTPVRGIRCAAGVCAGPTMSSEGEANRRTMTRLDGHGSTRRLPGCLAARRAARAAVAEALR